MKFSAYRDEVRAVVESTRNRWIQVHDWFEDHGFDVALTGPAVSRLVSEPRVKTNRTDA